MNALLKWAIAAAVAAIAAAAFFLFLDDDRPAAPERQAAEVDRSVPAPGGSTSATLVAPGAPVPAGPQNRQASEPQRAMPYRPASYLYYSEGRPAKTPSDDDAQATLQRILDVTQADAAQAAKIRASWRTHEDGRRVLWASAFPRMSGPRILDPEKLEELDSNFETDVFDVLRPPQRQRLSQELPPAGVPRTPPVTLYADPRLEQ